MSDSRISGTVRHGDGRMPAFSTEQISDSDLANLLAYLHTLK